MANSTNTTTHSNKNPTNQGHFLTLSLLTSLFFMWGFITSLNDILIPHLKSVFTLSYTKAMLVQFCFFTAYFVVSLPSGYLVGKIGYKSGIVVGLLIAGTGCLLFYPAANFQSYPLFLGAFFVLASGISLLQVAANSYVILLGNPETASSRLTLTQGFNSLGTTIAPYIGALFIMATAVKTSDEINLLLPNELLTYQTQQATTVQYSYLVLAALLFLIALTFFLTRLPNVITSIPPDSSTHHQAGLQLTQISAWNYKHLKLGAIAIFVYVGGEVSIGSFLVSFLGQPEIASLAEQEAGKYVSLYWGGAMVGRFLGTAIMQKITPQTLLTFNAILAIVLIISAMATSGSLAMWSLLGVGLFNSIMFPTIYSLALNGLGECSAQGSGILCMAIVGGAIIPLMQGLFADNIGIQKALFLPMLCYLFVAYYGYWGSRFSLSE
ncbi:MAG: sugar MFS transporter [Methyloglobulus sp.]